MSVIKSVGIVNEIPINSKYEPIINAVQQHIRQLETGKILEVQLERSNEATNLENALKKYTGKEFKVSIRTADDTIKGYVQLVTE